MLGGPSRDNAKFWRAVAVVVGAPIWYPGLTVRKHLELVRRTHEPVRGWWPTVLDGRIGVSLVVPQLAVSLLVLGLYLLLSGRRAR